MFRITYLFKESCEIATLREIGYVIFNCNLFRTILLYLCIYYVTLCFYSKKM